MSKEEKKLFMPLDLQFFASSKDDDSLDDNDIDDIDNPEDDDDNEDSKDDDDNDSGKDKKHEKTFTQKQVNRMMAKEKREGRKSAYTSIGFENEEEAKKAAAFFKAYNDSQKSEEDKHNEEKKNLEDGKTSAEKRAEEAEAKLACIMAGVNKESVEDIMAIAKMKITEDDSLEDVLAEMKKQPRYASFFSNSNEDGQKDDGTGHDSGHNRRKKEDKGSFGKRLAETNKSKSSEKKKSFFD